MNIAKLQYANSEQNLLLVNDGEAAIPWPCYSWHKSLVYAFLSAGGVIQPAQSSDDQVWDGIQWTLDLNRVKARAAGVIDRTAGETALRYITSRPGQEATYLYKAQQARAHRAAAYPADLAPYPLIAAELTALQVANQTATAQMASDSILETEALWLAKAAQIETARRVGKEKVRVATTAVAILAPRDEAVATLKAL